MSFQSPSPPKCILIKIENPALVSDNTYSCSLRIYPQQIRGASENYTVSDVAVNFWISNYSGGQSWRINSISNVNTGLQTLDCVIEDVEYYNYSLDPTIGTHGPSNGINGYCFELAENGLPNLVPIYSNTFTLSQTFISDLTARFNSRNYFSSYISVLQNSHTFVRGNFISLNGSGVYTLVTSTAGDVNIIGVVTSISIPTVNHFTYRPFGQFLKSTQIDTPLTAGVGSIYYLNSSGALTNTPDNYNVPVYIQVSSGGDGVLLKYRRITSLKSNSLTAVAVTDSPSVYDTTTTGSLTVGAGQTTGNVTIGNSTPASDSGTLTINKSTTLGASKNLTLASTGTLTTDTVSGTGVATNAALFSTTTTGNVTLGSAQTSGNITIGNTTPATDAGSLTINKNVTVGSGKTITLNATGGSVLSPTFNSTSATQALTVGGSNTTTDITIGAGQTSGNLTLGNTTVASDSGTLTINKNVTVGSGKTITLNATGGSVLSPTFNSTSATQALTIGGSNTTTNITIGSAQTSGTMTIGNATPASDSGTLTINKNTTLGASKNLTLASTGTLTTDTVSGTGVATNPALFSTTTTGSVTLGSAQTSGNVTIGNTTPATDAGTLTINKSTTLGASKNLTLASTGTLTTDTVSGTGVATNPSLFSTTTTGSVTLGSAQTSGNVTIGNTTPATDAGSLTINKNVTVGSGKTITLNATGGSVLSPTFNSTSATQALTVGGSNTTTDITIGAGQTSGNLTLGNTTVASDSGTLTINKNVTVGSGKTITLNATGGSVLSPTFNSTSATQALTVGGSNTTTNITIGSAQTSGTITIGNATPATDAGTLTINKTTTLGTDKNLTLQGTGKITTPNMLVSGLSASKIVLTDANDNLVSSSYTDSDFARLSAGSNSFNHVIINPTYTLTAPNIRSTSNTSDIQLGDIQTSGGIIMGNTTAANDTGTLTINKNVTVGSGKTITLNATGGKIRNNVYTGTSTSVDLGLGENSDTGRVICYRNIASFSSSNHMGTNILKASVPSVAVSLYLDSTAAISFGNNLGTGAGITINDNTTMASGKTITLNATGGSVLSPTFNSTSATQALTIGGTNTTTAITLGGALTSGSVNIGLIGMSGAINLLSDVNIGTSGTNKGLVCNYLSSFAVSDLTRLAATLTTGNIRLGENQTTGGITIGHQTPATDAGTLTINKTTTLGTDKNLTLQGTGKITTPNMLVSGLTASKIVLTDANDNLVSSSYTDTDFPRLTANNSLSGINTFSAGLFTTTANQTLNVNHIDLIYNLIRFYTPNYQSIADGAATNPQTLSTTSVNGTQYANAAWDANAYAPLNDGIVIPNGQPYYFKNDATYSSTFATTRTNLTATIAISTGNTVIFIYNSNTSLYEYVGIVKTASIPPSNQFNSRINSFTLPTTRGSNTNILTSNGSGGSTWASTISTDSISGSAITTSPSLFASTTTGVITLGAGQTTGGITIGHATPATDAGTLTINKNTTLASGKTLTLNTTGGKVICNTNEGTTATSTISLYDNLTTSSITMGAGQTTGGITIGNATPASDSSTLTINKRVALGASKNLVLGNTAILYSNNINGLAVNDTISLFSTTTSGHITLGDSMTTSNVRIGNITAATDTGTLTINKLIAVGDNKTLSMSSTGGRVVCNILDATSGTSTGYLYDNLTTASIFLGGSQTSGNVRIGNAGAGSDSGTLTINKNTTMGSGKLITATGGLTLGSQAILKGGLSGTVNITTAAYTNVILFSTASLAGFYQVFVYGVTSTQTYNVCCFICADNSGSIQTVTNRAMTLQASAPNYTITATTAPTSTVTMNYNVIRLF